MPDPAPLILYIFDVDMNSVSLAWSKESPVIEALENFTLLIRYSSSIDMITLNNSYYIFTAPEGSRPCEIYNFSVTATYIGATYTGDGCSVPSQVISMMLPLLPNITQLDSSLDYSLEKDPVGVGLSVSFEVCALILAYNVMFET